MFCPGDGTDAASRHQLVSYLSFHAAKFENNSSYYLPHRTRQPDRGIGKFLKRGVDKQPFYPSCRRSLCRLWGRLGFKSRTEPARFFSVAPSSVLGAGPSKCIGGSRFLIFRGGWGHLPSTGGALKHALVCCHYVAVAARNSLPKRADYK